MICPNKKIAVALAAVSGPDVIALTGLYQLLSVSASQKFHLKVLMLITLMGGIHQIARLLGLE